MERDWLIVLLMVVGIVISVISVVPMSGVGGDGGFPPPGDGVQEVAVIQLTAVGTAWDTGPNIYPLVGQYIEFSSVRVEVTKWTAATQYSLLQAWLKYLLANRLGFLSSSEYMVKFALTNIDTGQTVTHTAYVSIPTGVTNKEFTGTLTFSNAAAGNYQLEIWTDRYIRAGFVDYRTSVQYTFSITVGQTGVVSLTML